MPRSGLPPAALLEATQIGTLLLDRGLRTIWRSPAAESLFDWNAAEADAPIGQFPCRLVYPEVAADASQVVQSRVPLERKVRSPDDRMYLVRVQPYRDADAPAAPADVGGAVLSFVDVTSLSVQREAQDLPGRGDERLRMLADAVPQLIWTNDGAGVANYFNRRWFEYTGLSAAASIGPGWQAVVHPDDAPASKRQWRHALEVGALFDCEYRLRGADGSYRWFIGRNVPMRDADGRVAGWFGTATDIDDLKRAEAALRNSEEQFRRAIAESPIPVILIAESGEVLQISRTWSEFTGYAPQDLPTFDAWLDRAYGGGADEFRELVQRLFRGEVGVLNSEIDVTTRSGDRRRWSFSASAPRVLRDGRRFVVGMALDISERRRTEHALRESRERLQLIVENAREYAIFSLDTDRHITSWNAGAQSILGYTQDEVIGELGDIIFTLEDRADGAPQREAARAFSDGRAIDERWHVRRDGSRFWGSGIMTPMHGGADGAAIGLVKIFRDQTAELRAKEALEQSQLELRGALEATEAARDEAQAAGKAKDRFLAILSHELRTPLTPLLLAAQMLARVRSLPPYVRNTLEIIERNARLETHLVDDLLDLTRIATGKLQLHRVPADLNEIVLQAVEVSKPDFEAKAQRLDLELGPEGPPIVADVKRLQQVFWNLLKNASKFTPAGGRIGIRSRAGPDRWEVTVTDTGVGFDPGASERIFAAFEQASLSVARRYGGLGLGLAIAKASVEAHGGSIRAVSAGADLGAVFTVRFPTSARDRDA